MKKSRTRGAVPAVTTKDIADRTGLSKMTVSRVLNNHPYVSAETRRKVMAAVRELGFRPNMLAKRFFTGKTRLIGVVIPIEYMFSSFYFKDLFQGVLECAEEHGYDMLLHNSTSTRKPPMEKCMDLVKGKLVEGLLLAAPMAYDDYPARLTRESVPLVVMGETAKADKVNRVVIPNRASSEDAVARLIALGHRRIAILTFDVNHVESLERFQGYRDALEKAKIPMDDELVLRAHYSRVEAAREVSRLMKARPDVTAIYALNADMVIGAADALKEAGVRMPEQVSLVAFDDIPEMEAHTPPISAVRQFPYKLGYEACSMIVGMLSATGGDNRKVQCKVIDTEFMERGSMAVASARRGT